MSFADFLKTIHPSQHHLEHYNHFVRYELPELIQSFVTVIEKEDCSNEIRFGNVYVDFASQKENNRMRVIYPSECRQKNLTYLAPVYASVIHTRKYAGHSEGETTVFNRIVICNVPVMVRSVICNLTRAPAHELARECSMDKGGYFIINGNDRVLVTQQINAYNVVQVLDDKLVWSARTRSMSEETGHSVAIKCDVHKFKGIAESSTFTIPYLSKAIPIGILLRALGFQDAQTVYVRIGIDSDYIRGELESMFQKHMSEHDALVWMSQYSSRKPTKGTSTLADDLPEDAEDDAEVEEPEEPECDLEDADHEGEDADEEEGNEAEDEDGSELAAEREQLQGKISYVQQILTTEILPHLGVYATRDMVCDYLFLMLRRLFAVREGRLSPDDRDNLIYKRYENTGLLLLGLYKICFKNHLSGLRQSATQKCINEIITNLAQSVDKNVKHNFATGTWGIPKNNNFVRAGVSQILQRLSYIGTLSHLQRVSVLVGKQGKSIKIRQIHPSHYGYICLFETPEGATCGTVLNMTLSTRITRNYSTNYLRDLFEQFFERADHGPVEVWLNFTLKYTVPNEADFRARFRQLRVMGILPVDVNLYWDEVCEGMPRVFYILSDRGRLSRPLYDRAGRIVWLDSAESQSAQIAMFPHESAAFEYVEIHPSLTFSFATGCIPFADHNQSPRNVYESNMMKQALGMYATNYQIRYDTTYEHMEYVQKSLVSTEIARAMGCHDMPAGLNCVVAIMTSGSWNAEDSLVFNAAAIDRGLFHSTSYKTLTVEEYKTKSTVLKKFCIPDPSIQKPGLNYSKLDANGIIRAGERVCKRDVIVGRCCTDKNGEARECSEVAEDEGVVERADLFRHINGYFMVKIILKIIKIPERGDKFANLCAQKGTVGMIWPAEDMPFTSDGMIPDVMINPNALPSRMTISMLLEMVIGKAAALKGELADGTTYSENSTNIREKLEGILKGYGFSDYGWETMTNGQTGEMYRTRVFVGCSYYQKLKHMVKDKMHARDHGTVTTLTRQPLAGRSKDGGLRIGEMERDALLAHGCNSFLIKRLFDRSDVFYVYICNQCQIISNHKHECHVCKNPRLLWTRLPFASKLLFQQLQACLFNCNFKAEVL